MHEHCVYLFWTCECSWVGAYLIQLQCSFVRSFFGIANVPERIHTLSVQYKCCVNLFWTCERSWEDTYSFKLRILCSCPVNHFGLVNVPGRIHAHFNFCACMQDNIIVVRTSQFGLANRRYILINDEAYRSLASKL